ncbi:hypothetical protein ACFX13_005236 [Malus domestica]
MVGIGGKGSGEQVVEIESELRVPIAAPVLAYARTTGDLIKSFCGNSSSARAAEQAKHADEDKQKHHNCHIP